MFVDAVGPTKVLRAKLKARFPKVNFVVESKADSTYPVVSAASVIAKTLRDALLENVPLAPAVWEIGDPALGLGPRTPPRTARGQGYPGAASSIRYVQQAQHPIVGFPDNIVRTSWRTASKWFETVAPAPGKTSPPWPSSSLRTIVPLTHLWPLPPLSPEPARSKDPPKSARVARRKATCHPHKVRDRHPKGSRTCTLLKFLAPSPADSDGGEDAIRPAFSQAFAAFQNALCTMVPPTCPPPQRPPGA